MVLALASGVKIAMSRLEVVFEGHLGAVSQPRGADMKGMASRPIGFPALSASLAGSWPRLHSGLDAEGLEIPVHAAPGDPRTGKLVAFFHAGGKEKIAQRGNNRNFPGSLLGGLVSPLVANSNASVHEVDVGPSQRERASCCLSPASRISPRNTFHAGGATSIRRLRVGRSTYCQP